MRSSLVLHDSDYIEPPVIEYGLPLRMVACALGCDAILMMPLLTRPYASNLSGTVLVCFPQFTKAGNYIMLGCDTVENPTPYLFHPLIGVRYGDKLSHLY